LIFFFFQAKFPSFYRIEIMKKWTIGQRLIYGFAGVILTSFCVSLYAFARLVTIQDQASALAKTSLPGVVLMGEISARTQWEVAAVLAHIKANNDQAVQKVDDQLQENHRELGTLYKEYETTVSGATGDGRFQQLSAAYLSYLPSLEDVLKLSRIQNDKEAYDLYGVGIPAEMLDQLHRSFNQVDASPSH
jgi:hypothetical protein